MPRRASPAAHDSLCSWIPLQPIPSIAVTGGDVRRWGAPGIVCRARTLSTASGEPCSSVILPLPTVAAPDLASTAIACANPPRADALHPAEGRQSWAPAQPGNLGPQQRRDCIRAPVSGRAPSAEPATSAAHRRRAAGLGWERCADRGRRVRAGDAGKGHRVSGVYVALDLEATGMDPERDEIIEVAAIKFRDDRVLDRFESLVRPQSTIPFNISSLTGIGAKDVRRAPPFTVVAPRLRDFVRNFPIVGQSSQFDVEMLAGSGLLLRNPLYDTFQLATILIPDRSE